MSFDVAVTRVINPCALIELGDHAVLTDPYFANHWFFPMTEPIGLSPSRLPPLTAILGGHGVFDHWQPRSLAGYEHRSTTPVLVATERMARTARRAGFADVHVLAWGDRHELVPGVAVTAVPGERISGMRTNSYVLEAPDVTVLVGTEARSLAPIEKCAADHDVDVAILPIDGLEFLGRRLVMNAATALEATRILGAEILVPFHYSQRSVPVLLKCPSGIADLMQLAAEAESPIVRHAPTGTRLSLR